MDGVEIDPVRHTARVEAGSSGARFWLPLKNMGWLLYSVRHRPWARLGIRLAAAWAGWDANMVLSTDNVLQFEIVTSDGLLRMLIHRAQRPVLGFARRWRKSGHRYQYDRPPVPGDPGVCGQPVLSCRDGTRCLPPLPRLDSRCARRINHLGAGHELPPDSPNARYPARTIFCDGARLLLRREAEVKVLLRYWRDWRPR